MKTIFTKRWFVAALVRSVKTCCQTAIATIGTTALISEVNWLMVLSASALAGVLSILTSLAGLPEVKEEATLTETGDTETTDTKPKEGE